MLAVISIIMLFNTWSVFCLSCIAHFLRPILMNHVLCCTCRFQLLGIACLRAAVFDSEGELAGDLAPQRCADISDKAYTAQDVETETAKISASIPAHIKAAPNSKMFLRGFWFQAVKSDSVSVDKRELHIYNLARYPPFHPPLHPSPRPCLPNKMQNSSCWSHNNFLF